MAIDIIDKIILKFDKNKESFINYIKKHGDLNIKEEEILLGYLLKEQVLVRNVKNLINISKHYNLRESSYFISLKSKMTIEQKTSFDIYLEILNERIKENKEEYFLETILREFLDNYLTNLLLQEKNEEPYIKLSFKIDNIISSENIINYELLFFNDRLYQHCEQKYLEDFKTNIDKDIEKKFINFGKEKTKETKYKLETPWSLDDFEYFKELNSFLKKIYKKYSKELFKLDSKLPVAKIENLNFNFDSFNYNNKNFFDYGYFSAEDLIKIGRTPQINNKEMFFNNLKLI